MSTLSCQLLVSSSALTEDFYKVFFRRMLHKRAGVGGSSDGAAGGGDCGVIARDQRVKCWVWSVMPGPVFGAAFGQW